MRPSVAGEQMYSLHICHYMHDRESSMPKLQAPRSKVICRSKIRLARRLSAKKCWHKNCPNGPKIARNFHVLSLH